MKLASRTCPHCKKVLRNENTLFQHLKIHVIDRQKQFKCIIDNCDKKYYTKKDLTRHLQRAHSNRKTSSTVQEGRNFATERGHWKPHKCDKCPARFHEKNELLSHGFTHTDRRPYKCKECPSKFKRRLDLNRHIKKIHEDLHRKRSFGCGICQKLFFDKYKLNRHVKETHEQVANFLCYFCQKQFAQRTNLENHINTHTFEKPFVCSVTSCSYSVGSAAALSNHRRRHHPTTKQCPSRLFRCYFCLKKYPAISNLAIHLRNHTMEKPFSCRLCKMAFTNGCLFKAHIFTHTKEKPFKCSECDKSFVTISGKLKHIGITHNQNSTNQAPRRMLGCYFCSKQYPNSDKLRIHMGNHTMEKPFPCPFCKMSFKDRCPLKVHIFTHTKEKPFKCSECDQSFSTNLSRNNHIAIIHQEKRFFCDLCSHSYYYKNSLTRHLRKWHDT